MLGSAHTELLGLSQILQPVQLETKAYDCISSAAVRTFSLPDQSRSCNLQP